MSRLVLRAALPVVAACAVAAPAIDWDVEIGERCLAGECQTVDSRFDRVTVDGGVDRDRDRGIQLGHRRDARARGERAERENRESGG